MANNTFAIRKYITTCYNKYKDTYCWYNVQKLLSNEDLKKMEVYFQKHNYNFMLIINGCNKLRPQRTWGTFPTFLKPTSGYYPITKDNNTFVLCSWLKVNERYKKNIEELINYIPKNMEYVVFKKSEVIESE